ncbi:hypothetical protein NESM_000879800 [Novymonas esmeraldas]|uniref:Uncharacterized protein n=1 Tax=Novymonas esmeraldas TaxID=1808958 RepID=A0AAW0F132_9TRYP
MQAPSLNSGVVAAPAALPRHRAPLLATVWLDADRYTYEALCTAGAAATVVRPAGREWQGAESSIGDAAAAPTASPSLPHASPPLRVLPKETVSAAASWPATSGSADRASSDDDSTPRSSSARPSPAHRLSHNDADVQLNVVEEVELCTVVPVLARTFAVEQLVQQLVPCTHDFAPRAAAAVVAADTGDVACHARMARQSLARVRRAADEHLALLRRPSATDTAAATLDMLLPPVPVHMLATASSAPCGSDIESASSSAMCPGEYADRDAPELEQAGTGSAEAPADTPADGAPSRLPLSRLADMDSVDDGAEGICAAMEGVGADAVHLRAAERPHVPATPAAALAEASPGNAEVVCTPFAAAQARYERHRRSVLLRGGSAASGPTTTSATAAAAEAGPGPPSTAHAAHAFWSCAAAASLAPALSFPDSALDLAVSAMAATPGGADAGLEALPLNTTLAAAVAPPPPRPGATSSPRVCGDGVVVAPLASAARAMRVAEEEEEGGKEPRQGGAVVEWSTGVVSYTADTLGLYEEQQARAHRFYHLAPPPPSPSSPPSTGERATLRGAVLSQLQRLAEYRRGERAAAHGADAGRHAYPSPHHGRCHRCSPTLVQFAQVPSLASPVLRRYLDVLHQTALPGLSAQQQPPAQHAQRHRSGATAAGVDGATASDDAVPLASGGVSQTRSAQLHHTLVDADDGAMTGERGRGPGELSAEVDRADAAEDSVMVTRSRKRRRDATTVTTTATSASVSAAAPTSVGSPAPQASSNGGHVQRCRGALVDPLDVFPALPRWLTSPERIAGHDGESPSESNGAVALSWVDDAVLDEAVVVGVVPRGQPHQLQLVAPSHAFCMALAQGLEEVAEAVAHIVPLMEPAPGKSGAEAASVAADPHDRLEAHYADAVWATLRACLTDVELQTVTGLSHDSPRLARWASLSAVTATDASALSRRRSGGDGRRGGGRDRRTCSAGDGAAAASRSPSELSDDPEVSHAVMDSVRTAAVQHTRACLSAAEDVVARVVLTALVPVVHRRITIMYELLRHFASKSLYTSHRAQCEAYQHWFSTTPSPAAVLRLLQRSRRFSRALARCYPQYDLCPTPLPPLPEHDMAASPPSPSAASPARSSSAPLAATCVPTAAAAAALSTPAEEAVTYVPEAALLDPLYLQRFAWWMHRAHHSNGGGGGGSGSSSGAVHMSRPTSAVLGVSDGDYLRTLPVHEQDASIRTVLRSIAQKGRTLTLAEVSQHIHSLHTSYVYL